MRANTQSLNCLADFAYEQDLLAALKILQDRLSATHDAEQLAPHLPNLMAQLLKLIADKRAPVSVIALQIAAAIVSLTGLVAERFAGCAFAHTCFDSAQAL